jgi:hypothetical protein
MKPLKKGNKGNGPNETEWSYGILNERELRV